jgi:hypothetical protein
MKRKDAIQIIKETAQHQISYEIAEKVLDALEKAGMLPPKIYLSVWDRHDNCWE